MDLQRKTDHVTEAKVLVSIMARWAASGDEVGDLMAAGLMMLQGVLDELECQ